MFLSRCADPVDLGECVGCLDIGLPRAAKRDVYSSFWTWIRCEPSKSLDRSRAQLSDQADVALDRLGRFRRAALLEEFQMVRNLGRVLVEFDNPMLTASSIPIDQPSIGHEIKMYTSPLDHSPLPRRAGLLGLPVDRQSGPIDRLSQGAADGVRPLLRTIRILGEQQDITDPEAAAVSTTK
jgi:hypothetical protein